MLRHVKLKKWEDGRARTGCADAGGCWAAELVAFLRFFQFCTDCWFILMSTDMKRYNTVHTKISKYPWRRYAPVVKQVTAAVFRKLVTDARNRTQNSNSEEDTSTNSSR